MTKEKALYQVKLILDNLNEEEYNFISEEDIDYINENMEYTEDITIDSSKSLEEQVVDEKACEYLEKILNSIEKNKRIFNEYKGVSRLKLIQEINKYKVEVGKNNEIKKLLEDYKNLVNKKNEELENVKENNKLLYSSIQKCPKIIRKIFFKEFELKFLKY
ncbi:MAG: hypothetical protein J6J60_10270 [Clostridia bacterium]|nr:hypothetical protein [Clostridia bacterium]